MTKPDPTAPIDFGDAVFESLTEEECYLHAILSDESGLDQAEFLWTDHGNHDGCYRAFPFQVAWWRCQDPRQVDQGARSLGKSERVMARSLAFSYNHPSQEHLITGPQGIHVSLITDRIEARIFDTRFYNESIVGGRGGVTHRPLLIKWANGARTITRLPQNTGLGLKGCVGGDALILTPRGWVPAAEIDPSDLVWSHTGRWVRIVSYESYTEDQAWIIEGDGAPPITVSALHRLLVRERKVRVAEKGRSPFGAPYWESADVIAAEPSAFVWCAPGTFTGMPFDETHQRETLDAQLAAGFVARPAAAATALTAHSLGQPVRWVAGDNDHWRIELDEAPATDGPFIGYQITSVEPAPAPVQVFNIVSETHSFCADGIFHHNTHPTIVDIDEGQDFPPLAWKEMPEIVRHDIPGNMEIVHGVSKGVQDHFWDITTKPELGWKVHRYAKMHRPDFTEEDRIKAIADYGSEESPDYLRNVLGEHGNSQNRIFNLDLLMRSKDEEFTEYSQHEYTMRRMRLDEIETKVREVTGADAALEEVASEVHTQVIRDLLGLNPGHLLNYERFYGGADIGLVSDPTEIIVAAEYLPTDEERRADRHRLLAVPPKGLSRLKVLARINAVNIPTWIQEEIVFQIIQHYQGMASFSMDATGPGWPIYQALQRRAGLERAALFLDYSDENEPPIPDAQADAALTIIKGYNFGAKAVVSLDEKKAAELAGAEPIEVIRKAGIKRYVKDAATDELRNLVERQRWLMPHDPEMIDSLNGQTWAVGQEPIGPYGEQRRAYSVGKFHILDGCRMLVLGRYLEPLEQFARSAKPPSPVLERY